MSLARCGLCGQRRGDFLSVLPRVALVGSLAAVRFFFFALIQAGIWGFAIIGGVSFLSASTVVGFALSLCLRLPVCVLS